MKTKFSFFGRNANRAEGVDPQPEPLGVFRLAGYLRNTLLSHNLFDINLLINRTLVYGTLTAIVVGFYILVVGYLGILFE